MLTYTHTNTQIVFWRIFFNVLLKKNLPWWYALIKPKLRGKDGGTLWLSGHLAYHRSSWQTRSPVPKAKVDGVGKVVFCLLFFFLSSHKHHQSSRGRLIHWATFELKMHALPKAQIKEWKGESEWGMMSLPRDSSSESTLGINQEKVSRQFILGERPRKAG